MTIYQGSRYEDETIVTVNGVDGMPHSTVVDDISRLPASFNYTRYTTVAGDRADNLAQQFLGDAEQWGGIADANPRILYWENLPAGLRLRIPDGLPS